jgi:hypothetical protein
LEQVGIWESAEVRISNGVTREELCVRSGMLRTQSTTELKPHTVNAVSVQGGAGSGVCGCPTGHD